MEIITDDMYNLLVDENYKLKQQVKTLKKKNEEFTADGTFFCNDHEWQLSELHKRVKILTNSAVELDDENNLLKEENKRLKTLLEDRVSCIND